MYVYHEGAPCEQGAARTEIGGGRSGGEGGGGRRPADGRRGPRRGKLRILRVPTARVHLPSPLCHPVQPRRGYIRTGLLVLRYHSLTSLSLQSDLLESTSSAFKVLPPSSYRTSVRATCSEFRQFGRNRFSAPWSEGEHLQRERHREKEREERWPPS